jgi:predicted nucleic acid-binding protein
MDACCFIELALHAVGKNEADRDNDLWFLKELLNAASDEEIEVLTSTLSIAECAHAKGDVSDDVKSLFKRFLTSGRYVLLVQDSVLVAEKARNLRWVHGLSFGGADSIHLASALELRCDEFLTWDNRLHASAAALNDLALPVRFPRDTHCLPDRYRQLAIPAPQAALIAADDIPKDTPKAE